MKTLPQTAEEVLDLIEKAERSRKFAWTASRVATRAGLYSQLAEADPEELQATLTKLLSLLESLELQGRLVRRLRKHSTVFGQEKAFDFIPVDPDPGKA